MPVVSLVCRDLDRIREEFREIFQRLDGMVAKAVDDSGGQRQQMQGQAREVALVLLLHNASAFERRICNPFQRHLGRAIISLIFTESGWLF